MLLDSGRAAACPGAALASAASLLAAHCHVSQPDDAQRNAQTQSKRALRLAKEAALKEQQAAADAGIKHAAFIWT